MPPKEEQDFASLGTTNQEPSSTASEPGLRGRKAKVVRMLQYALDLLEDDALLNEATDASDSTQATMSDTNDTARNESSANITLPVRALVWPWLSLPHDSLPKRRG